MEEEYDQGPLSSGADDDLSLPKGTRAAGWGGD